MRRGGIDERLRDSRGCPKRGVGVPGEISNLYSQPTRWLAEKIHVLGNDNQDPDELDTL